MVAARRASSSSGGSAHGSKRVRAARARTRSRAAGRAATAAAPGIAAAGAAARPVDAAGSSPSRPQRVRVLRRRRTARASVPSLDDPARVHHHDPVGDLGDDAQVVRDEHDRRAEVAAQLADQRRGSAPGS